ncbi:MAG: aminopeptidase P family N-terminal domain-containing protein [Rubrivivax sp.]|nr:aminopeptidase P family N-terminal domain-containing protein [Rubrivivax sp.]
MQGTSDLPPAIRALKPMREGVTPISVAERQGRLEKAKRLMREQGIDALMLTGGTSMVYFTGIQWGLSERLLAAFIPATGKPFLVTPKFEEERAMEQVALGPMTEGADVYAWEENEDPYALIANGLRARGLTDGDDRGGGERCAGSSAMAPGRSRSRCASPTARPSRRAAASTRTRTNSRSCAMRAR